MKKITILAFFCILLFLSFTNIFEAKAQKHLIKANLLGIMSGQYGGSYELVLSEKLTFVANASYISRSRDTGFGVEVVSESGYMIAPELRFYLGSIYAAAPRGLFLGPNFLYEKVDVEVQDVPADTLVTSGAASNIGYGLVVGNQWVFNEKFVLEIAFNPYYNQASLEGGIRTRPVDQPEYYERKEGFQFNRVMISFGLAF